MKIDVERMAIIHVNRRLST